MTTTVGDARVSTFEQLLDLQRDALDAAGCTRIVTDTASGGRSDRPGLQQALDYVREGDILVVWRLDRLGRSLKYLIEIITSLNERGIGFKSLTEQIDTTTSGRQADLPCLRRAGGVRAGCHPGADTGGSRRSPGAWPDGRQAKETRERGQGGDGIGALRRQDALGR
jgi:hypothetical protein